MDGRLVPDPAATLPGRGAWVHESQKCFADAARRGGFQRALLGSVDIPQDTVDFTHTWPRSASTS
ncbi:MAG: YlxR family protein [Actinomycetota bacterium]|nr:YlxR family protein [Actinomycetota bacterium]